ncbi:hypothetical protein LV84_00156 [Algoriphagus ratkowskyi]|uniref:DUF4221 domain-containing protein n=1 Tax=Algoriphagus ratkowskyi TaxID=57028 RepID=A0A2W7RK07_9BACT|nr:hypothetical protein [Algoriphagus ratkowskyi]PZX61168.1 hypothetical protein LV84_00156 [Algoriphagus ratkowskyi]TXD79292.1 hypothetical protein ESW18_03410 [Algoriphagus ratkowskyi]
MKLNSVQLALSALAFSVFSCGEKAEKTNEPKTFSLEITDSVQVDYLGEMMLLDYEPKADKYLLATDSYYEYLEVDEKGKIINHHKFSEDGVDPVGQALGLGYFNGDVTVFNPPKGYYRFQDSTKVGEFTIPYPHQVFMMYPKLGVFESGNKIYYPKPWPESLAVNMLEGEFYQAMYKLPIIEAQDKTTGDTLAALSLPRNSDLLGDQIHGFPIPVYTLDQDKLMLSMWFEPRFYVYNKVGDQFVYEKTVDVNIPDWVPYTPVPLDRPEQFFAENQKKTPGNLTNMLVSGDYYIAVYNKGLSEAKMTELGPPTDGGLAKRRNNPNYAAIFDKDFNQLATNVPFPLTSNFPMVVNNEGELVVSKVAGLSDTEDDGIVLYKLKLTEK